VKVGDLVVCDCPNDTWYKGQVGMLIEFNADPFHPNGRGSAIVWYATGETIHILTKALKVMS
jgi:hypothetical protein